MLVDRNTAYFMWKKILVIHELDNFKKSVSVSEEFERTLEKCLSKCVVYCSAVYSVSFDPCWYRCAYAEGDDRVMVEKFWDFHSKNIAEFRKAFQDYVWMRYRIKIFGGDKG